MVASIKPHRDEIGLSDGLLAGERAKRWSRTRRPAGVGS